MSEIQLSPVETSRLHAVMHRVIADPHPGCVRRAALAELLAKRDDISASWWAAFPLAEAVENLVTEDSVMFDVRSLAVACGDSLTLAEHVLRLVGAEKASFNGRVVWARGGAYRDSQQITFNPDFGRQVLADEAEWF